MRKIQTPLEKQLYNDGVLKVYTVRNIAPKGMMPKYDKVLVHGRVPYENKTAGEKRRYYAQQEGREFSRIVRTAAEYDISEGHVVELGDKLYKVITVNLISSIYPGFSEISLRKVDKLEECIN